MVRNKRLIYGLLAAALTVAAAGCGGAAPNRSAESDGKAYVTPVVPAANAPAADPNQTVSSPPAGTPSQNPMPALPAPTTGQVSPANPGTGSTPAATPTAPAQQPAEPQTLSFSSLERGAHSGVTNRTAVLIADPETWNTHWAKHASVVVPVPGAPPVDFSQNSIVAVYMGEQRTGGYSLEITSVQLTDGKLLVTVRQGRPAPGAITTQALTQPYHMVAIPKVPAGTTLEVKWQ